MAVRMLDVLDVPIAEYARSSCPSEGAPAALSDQLREALPHALERQEFELHYQPIFALEPFQLIGMEALLRWRHDYQEPVRPEQFIAAAEDSGDIHAITTWVFTTACRDFARIQRRTGQALQLSFNLSAYCVNHPCFIPWFCELLDDVPHVTEFLHIEITETSALVWTQRLLDFFQRLQVLGISTWLDDFGRGYSNLKYAADLPLKGIKMDRSLLTNVTEDPRSAQFYQDILQLAHNLGLEVTAEGVEQAGELRFLQISRCDYGQGFLFAPAMPIARFMDYVEASKTTGFPNPKEFATLQQTQ
ncbi:EAL domain-containing protein [Aliidiomarina sanyensis]|uniref:EAL domain-containing protein n=1 Tax=Aliidiomarina sanyensis TaxID=1249555 RepID=A0A432WBC9_9GAMM|nr:EAL domain-containing protein [Aliidiomarina sanyensis]RUO29063.1 hypothetical protein CWE11_10330 [Aliidiomarina sanyensis]